VVSVPLPDGGWTISFAGITPRARAEEEAMRRALLLDTILAALPHGICGYGADHRITNRSYSRAVTEEMALCLPASGTVFRYGQRPARGRDQHRNRRIARTTGKPQVSAVPEVPI